MVPHEFLKCTLITLLNIRSIGRHVDDFLSDIHINEAPIVCFTETQMTENMTMLLHSDLLESYETIVNSNTNKFKSFIMLYSGSLFECDDTENFDGFTCANFI